MAEISEDCKRVTNQLNDAKTCVSNAYDAQKAAAEKVTAALTAHQTALVEFNSDKLADD